MSNFFRNRAKAKNDRLKKIKSRIAPIDQSKKDARTKKQKVFSDEELEQLLDDSKTDELFSSLNEEQKEAATSDNAHNLIIASAGTGKTSTIVARVLHLLNNNIKPNEIILITFTSKAAREMSERIKRYIPPQIANEILIGTFHATAIKLLKRNNIDANIKSPKVLRNIFILAANKYGIQRYKLDIENFYEENTLIQLNATYQAKGNGKTFEEWFRDEYPNKDDQFENLHHYESIFELYQEELKKENILGFNELLIKARESGKEIHDSFKEIIIDEYQDTSRLQINYIEALAHERLFCVGDYDQSIYAFNGADISIIASFKDKYPNASVINLKKNYRSQKPILELAQKSIAHNERLYPKELHITKLDESKPVVVEKYNSQEDQYEAIAQKIADGDRAFSDIAILYRTNATATKMEVALKELNIECIRDDSSSFFEIDEVLYTINLLRLLKGSDKLALIDILNSFSLQNYSSQIVDILLQYDMSLSDSIIHPKKNYKFNAADKDEFFRKHIIGEKTKNQKVSNIFFEIYQMITSHKRLNHKDFVEKLFASDLVCKAMEAFARKKARFKNKTDEEKYLNNLNRNMQWQNTLKKIILNYDTIDKFVHSLNYSQTSEDEEKTGVWLLTVHGSKGLEYDEVYVVDLNDKIFPNTRLMNDGGGGLDEERRLFYVAVTRAREELTLSYSVLDHKNKPLPPSIFLCELGLAEAPVNVPKPKKQKSSIVPADAKLTETITLEKPNEEDLLPQLLQDIETSYAKWFKLLDIEPKSIQTTLTLNSIKSLGQAYNDEMIKLNKDLLLKYQHEYIDHVVRHEFGHIATHILYENVKAHGKEWKAIMKKLGDENPSSTTPDFKIDKSGYIWKCDCGEHVLSKKKHCNYFNGEDKSLSCKKCHSDLIFTKKFIEIKEDAKNIYEV